MRKKLSMRDLIMSLEECSKDFLLDIYENINEMKIIIEDEEKIDEFAKIFSALSNPLRLKIITLLA